MIVPSYAKREIDPEKSVISDLSILRSLLLFVCTAEANAAGRGSKQDSKVVQETTFDIPFCRGSSFSAHDLMRKKATITRVIMISCVCR